MFAFSLWDKKNKILTLARDRLGEKPFYYGWQIPPKVEVFLFGSELKALKSFPNIDLKVDQGSLSLFLKHAYIQILILSMKIYFHLNQVKYFKFLYLNRNQRYLLIGMLAKLLKKD